MNLVSVTLKCFTQVHSTTHSVIPAITTQQLTTDVKCFYFFPSDDEFNLCVVMTCIVFMFGCSVLEVILSVICCFSEHEADSRVQTCVFSPRSVVEMNISCCQKTL